MKKVLFRFNLQSLSDVITNSSSELFVVKSKNNETVEAIQALIDHQAAEFRYRDSGRIQQIQDEYYKKAADLRKEGKDPYKELEYPGITIARENLESSGGMGGEIDVFDIHREYDERFWPLKHTSFDEYLELIAKEENTTKEELKSRIYIDIDNARHATMQWIKENFEVVKIEY